MNCGRTTQEGIMLQLIPKVSKKKKERKALVALQRFRQTLKTSCKRQSNI